MFTTVDKAIAAVLGGLSSFALLQYGLELEFLTPEMITMISSLVAGFLTYLVPNAPADPG